MGRQTKPEKQQSNKLTIGIEKRPRLDAGGTRGQSSMPRGTGGQGSTTEEPEDINNNQPVYNEKVKNKIVDGW